MMEPHAKKPQADDHKSDPRDLDLAAKVAELEVHVQKLTDIAGRAQADLQNAKMRMERDSDDLRKFAAQSIILKLLPVIDNFQRAFLHLPPDLDGHEWVKGISAIEQDLIRQMTALGLTKMHPVGQHVNPEKHEIIVTGPGEEGKVIEVLEEGYELHGKVLRPAKVKVGGGLS